MRASAIIANLLQIIIILAVFLYQGIALGGLTIFALFVLLIIACFNLLVLMFPADNDRVAAGEKKTIVKRQDLRVTYSSAGKPALKVGHRHYDVLDIAESGARIVVGRHERLKRRFRCQIHLKCGQMLHVKAVVMRREGDEAALAFKPPIEYLVLLKEKQAIAVL